MSNTGIPPLSSFLTVHRNEMPKLIGDIPVSFTILRDPTAPKRYIHAIVGEEDRIICLREYDSGFLANEYPHPYVKDDILQEYDEYAEYVTKAYAKLRERREKGIRDTEVIECPMYKRYYGADCVKTTD